MPEKLTESVSHQNEIPGLQIDKTSPSLDDIASRTLAEQWERFWQLRQLPTNGVALSNSLGDRNLLHHMQYNEVALSNVLASGVLAGELGYQEKETMPEDAETHFCADFFVNYGEKSVPDYIAFAQSFQQKEGSRLKVKQIESYNCPQANNDSIAIIIDPLHPELRELLMHAGTAVQPGGLKGFPVSFPKAGASEEVARRHLAVLVGIPANFITGIVVGGKISADSEKLSQVKQLISEANLQIPILDTKGEVL